jgi:hypothetical protein
MVQILDWLCNNAASEDRLPRGILHLQPLAVTVIGVPGDLAQRIGYLEETALFIIVVERDLLPVADGARLAPVSVVGVAHVVPSATLLGGERSELL